MKTNAEKQQESKHWQSDRVLTTRGCTGGGTRACSWSPAQRRQEEESQEPGRARQVTNPLSTYGSSAARTAEGSASEKASRQAAELPAQSSRSLHEFNRPAPSSPHHLSGTQEKSGDDGAAGGNETDGYGAGISRRQTKRSGGEGSGASPLVLLACCLPPPGRRWAV